MSSSSNLVTVTPGYTASLPLVRLPARALPKRWGRQRTDGAVGDVFNMGEHGPTNLFPTLPIGTSISRVVDISS